MMKILKWEIPTAETIQPKTWVKVTGIIFLGLLVLIAWNFAMDNQRALAGDAKDLGNFAQLTASTTFDHNGFSALGKDEFVLWLSTLDKNTYDKLNTDENLPLCVNNHLVYQQDKVSFNFNTQAFWFEFLNGSQVEFTRLGKVNCYIPTDTKGVNVLVSNCNEVCPEGIDSLDNYDFNKLKVKK